MTAASWVRARAMIVKEFWAMMRDPVGRVTVFAPPLLQLCIFTFAATLEVDNIDIGLIDRSQGTVSHELVSSIESSPNFRSVIRLNGQDPATQAIDRQDVIAVIVIEPDFDRRLARGEDASIGLIMDGRRSNSAQIIASYIQRIAASVSADRPGATAPELSVVINLFNPSLEFLWFNLPAILTVVLSISSIAICAQTVAREREMGTFEQLQVSPLRVEEIMIGKMVPTIVVSFINGLVFLVLSPTVFGVPFTGSLLLFLISALAYIIALTGLGMLISALSRTQQQALLASFIITIPMTILSGFASPIENMPGWLQYLTYLNPSRYFLEIAVGLYLKDLPFGIVLANFWPMIVIAMVTVTSASWLYKNRME